MFLLASRLLIAFAAVFVPRSLRAEWKAEWRHELRRRSEAGSSQREIWGHAKGALRDAALVRKSRPESAAKVFFSRPFRAELVFFLLAAAVWLAAAGWRSPEPPFPNASRVVVLERGFASLGARRPMMSRPLVERASGIEAFQAVAPFRLWYRIPGAAFVSRNFFELLGVTPAMGRVLASNEPQPVVVITNECWRDQFHSDPSILGMSIELGYQSHQVIGVLPARFRFISDTTRYFVPLPANVRTVGAVALLKPNATLAEAQERFRELAKEVEPDWKPEAFGLRPLVEPRTHEPALALGLGLAAFLGSAAFLLWKGVRGLKYYMSLAARLLLTVAAFSAVQVVVSRLLVDRYLVSSILLSWPSLALCTAAVIIVVRDHLQRCPVCLERLRMPASLGSWSSVMVDPPATEYVCPNGHGTLYVSETGETHSRWTTLDESWRDLFARRGR